MRLHSTGRRIRILKIVDDDTRECLRAVVDTSISTKWVVRELADLVAERAKGHDRRFGANHLAFGPSMDCRTHAGVTRHAHHRRVLSDPAAQTREIVPVDRVELGCVDKGWQPQFHGCQCDEGCEG